MPRQSSLRSLRLTVACAVAAAGLMAGCMVGPDYHKPKSNLKSGYASLGYAGSRPTTGISTATGDEARVRGWWNAFNDPVLGQLVDAALTSNLDLVQAEARIRQARARLGQTRADLLPTANATGAYRRSGRGPQEKPNNGVEETDLYSAGFDASWEIDIFGGLRRSVEAADADLLASYYDYDDVRLSLVAELAVNYFDLRAAQQRLAIAVKNIEIQQRTTAIARTRRSAGVVSGVDLLNAEAQLASTRSQIPQLEQNARAAAFAIALLLGREPQTMLPLMADSSPIPTTPPEVPVGLPSDLLRRRPDIRRAETRLHSATARIGVATSDLFPKFSLTGSFGSDGQQLRYLVNASNLSWAYGPSFRWNIFDAGRIRSRIVESEAARDEVLAAYDQSVLRALGDVETSLTSYESEQRRRLLLSVAVDSNRRAVDLAQQQYSIGEIEFTNLLTAQRELLQSEDSLVQSDRNTAVNLVSIYKALGGGWDPNDLPAIQAPDTLTPSAALTQPATLPAATVPASTQPATKKTSD